VTTCNGMEKNLKFKRDGYNRVFIVIGHSVYVVNVFVFLYYSFISVLRFNDPNVKWSHILRDKVICIKLYINVTARKNDYILTIQTS